jgi:hypothetical protein
MLQGTHGLDKQWTQIFLACMFLVTCVSTTIGQCVDGPDRRRKEADPFSQPPNSRHRDLCDPQLLEWPGLAYQPCRPSEEVLPLQRIKEDRAYLEFLSQSVAIDRTNADELDLQAVSQWAGEVRKRVRRLRDNLALPDTEGISPSISEDAQILSDRHEIAEALLVLSRLTKESLRNPVLSGRLLDQTLAAKAVRELAQIEDLAGLLQNSCQVLSKNSR